MIRMVHIMRSSMNMSTSGYENYDKILRVHLDIYLEIIS